MSWICPHEVKDFCKRLKKRCVPGIKGCVLDGKPVFTDADKGGENMGEREVTLDLRPMPPFERHEKIFQIWNTLKSGQSLKIINDHDPKPLRYQFEVEYKDKYEWKYEQQGPEDWIVKIKRM